MLVGCEGRRRLGRAVVRSRVAREDFCEERLRRRSRGNGGRRGESRSCWWRGEAGWSAVHAGLIPFHTQVLTWLRGDVLSLTHFECRFFWVEAQG